MIVKETYQKILKTFKHDLLAAGLNPIKYLPGLHEFGSCPNCRSVLVVCCECGGRRHVYDVEFISRKRFPGDLTGDYHCLGCLGGTNIGCAVWSPKEE